MHSSTIIKVYNELLKLADVNSSNITVCDHSALALHGYLFDKDVLYVNATPHAASRIKTNLHCCVSKDLKGTLKVSKVKNDSVNPTVVSADVFGYKVHVVQVHPSLARSDVRIEIDPVPHLSKMELFTMYLDELSTAEGAHKQEARDIVNWLYMQQANE